MVTREPHASHEARVPHTTRHDHTAGIIRSWQPFASWSPCQGTLSRLDTVTRTRIITPSDTPGRALQVAFRCEPGFERTSAAAAVRLEVDSHPFICPTVAELAAGG